MGDDQVVKQKTGADAIAVQKATNAAGGGVGYGCGYDTELTTGCRCGWGCRSPNKMVEVVDAVEEVPPFSHKKFSNKTAYFFRILASFWYIFYTCNF